MVYSRDENVSDNLFILSVTSKKESPKQDENGPKVLRVPRIPTEKERDAHEATHLPHAEWCEFCVKGRSRNKAHPKKKKDEPKHQYETKDKMRFEWQEVLEGQEEGEVPRPRAGAEPDHSGKNSKGQVPAIPNSNSFLVR